MSYLWSAYQVDHTSLFRKHLRTCPHQRNLREFILRKNLGFAPCLPDHFSQGHFQNHSEPRNVATFNLKQNPFPAQACGCLVSPRASAAAVLAAAAPPDLLPQGSGFLQPRINDPRQAFPRSQSPLPAVDMQGHPAEGAGRLGCIPPGEKPEPGQAPQARSHQQEQGWASPALPPGSPECSPQGRRRLSPSLPLAPWDRNPNEVGPLPVAPACDGPNSTFSRSVQVGVLTSTSEVTLLKESPCKGN